MTMANVGLPFQVGVNVNTRIQCLVLGQNIDALLKIDAALEVNTSTWVLVGLIVRK